MSILKVDGIRSNSASSDAINLDDTGKVGIGTTSPISTLHLHEAGASGSPIIQFSNGDTGATSGDGFAIGVADNESPFIYNRENTDLRFGTNNAERMRILAGGGLTFNGDTAAANALDDYEEGTFSPTMRGNNTNSTGPITGAGKYTKIGRICHIQYSFQNKPSGDLPSGEYIQIHGLPFTASGYSQVAPHGMNYKVGFNNSWQYYMFIPANNTIMWGYYNQNGSAYQPWGTDQWRQTSQNIYHETTFTYMVS